MLWVLGVSSSAMFLCDLILVIWVGAGVGAGGGVSNALVLVLAVGVVVSKQVVVKIMVKGCRRCPAVQCFFVTLFWTLR